MELKNSFRAAALVVALTSLSIFAAPALADSRYCSQTGDFCVHAASSPVTLDLASFGFSGKYTLTVKTPKGNSTKKTFKLQRSGDAFKSSVRWSKHFPNAGAGTYTATWKLPSPATTLHTLKFKVK